MAERKVLNKYYPPDFDPAKLRRFEKKTTRRMCNVRMMLPMSVRCYTCGNYMYLGTKFNMKVEAVKDEDYLGIKIYRFYFKCTRCYGEITFKTDPKNHDYVSEWGASRNHEQWKDMVNAEEEYKEVKQTEMKEDAMKSLEHRTYDSKREMDILESLDQVKNLNRRQAVMNYDELFEKVFNLGKDENEVIDIDEIDVKGVFDKVKIKRIEDYNSFDSEVNQFDMTKHLTKKLEREESIDMITKAKKLDDIEKSNNFMLKHIIIKKKADGNINKRSDNNKKDNEKNTKQKAVNNSFKQPQKVTMNKISTDRNGSVNDKLNNIPVYK
jgi:hypothetical protein